LARLIRGVRGLPLGHLSRVCEVLRRLARRRRARAAPALAGLRQRRPAGEPRQAEPWRDPPRRVPAREAERRCGARPLVRGSPRPARRARYGAARVRCGRGQRRPSLVAEALELELMHVLAAPPDDHAPAGDEDAAASGVSD
jgi:hypothetical protein